MDALARLQCALRRLNVKERQMVPNFRGAQEVAHRMALGAVCLTEIPHKCDTSDRQWAVCVVGARIGIGLGPDPDPDLLSAPTSDVGRRPVHMHYI